MPARLLDRGARLQLCWQRVKRRSRLLNEVLILPEETRDVSNTREGGGTLVSLSTVLCGKSEHCNSNANEEPQRSTANREGKALFSTRLGTHVLMRD